MADLTVLNGGKEDQTFSIKIIYRDGEIETFLSVKEVQMIDYILRFTDDKDVSYLVNMETVKVVKTW